MLEITKGSRARGLNLNQWRNPGQTTAPWITPQRRSSTPLVRRRCHRIAGTAETVEIVIQINGKLRSRLTLAVGSGKDVLEKEALKDSKVQAALSGKSVGKVIIVPDKLVNIVAK